MINKEKQIEELTIEIDALTPQIKALQKEKRSKVRYRAVVKFRLKQDKMK